MRRLWSLAACGFVFFLVPYSHGEVIPISVEVTALNRNVGPFTSQGTTYLHDSESIGILVDSPTLHTGDVVQLHVSAATGYRFACDRIPGGYGTTLSLVLGLTNSDPDFSGTIPGPLSFEGSTGGVPTLANTYWIGGLQAQAHFTVESHFSFTALDWEITIPETTQSLAADVVVIQASTLLPEGYTPNPPDVQGLTLEAIPEPTTLSLLVLGGLALIRRRRKI